MMENPIFHQLSSVESKDYVDKKFHSAGGMKAISTVRDLRTDRIVAMAEMKKEGEVEHEAIEQFLREARITAALEHPNIVPIYDISLNELNRPYFTMKFMEDQSLKKVIREIVKLNPVYTRAYTLNNLLEIFLKICDAVSYAHFRRVVHLDIKPDNIMIGQHGEAYICDWGLARVMDMSIREYENIVPLDETILNDITLFGVVRGTPGFMAPEQIDSKFGDKCELTDIYSLGALLYTVLFHKRPFWELNNDDAIAATIDKCPRSPSTLDSSIPESLSAVCMKAMSKAQKNRYQDVESLMRDIRAYQEGFATQAENASALKVLMKLLQRNKLLALMITLIIMTAVVIGGVSGRMISQRELTSMRQVLQEKEKSEKLQKLLNKEKNKFFVDNSRLETVSSIRGQAIKLNGKGQGLRIPHINFTEGSIVFWFKPHKTGYQYPYFFQLGNYIWHISDRTPTESGGLIIEGGWETLPPIKLGGTLWNKWSHFAITVAEDRQVKFFVNGIEVSLNRKFQPGLGFSLGCWHKSGLDKHANAYFDELSIWSKVLLREEILELANSGLTKRKPGLTAYFPFDGDAKDKVNEMYNFELEGEPVFLP